MSATTDMLEKHGLEITDEELAHELGASLDRDRSSDLGVLGDHEIQTLKDHAGVDAAVLDGLTLDEARRRQILGRTRSATRMLRRLLTRAEAAERLGLDVSSVSRRVSDGRLWAIADRGRRIPAWQIHDGALLPGLATVIAAIPDEVDAATVQGVMTTPQDDLDGATPIDYLASGGDPEAVAAIVAWPWQW